MKLYEIDKALYEVIESGYSVDDETGEILFSPDEFDALDGERTAKLEACALYVKNLQAEADAIKAERDALDERCKVKQRKAERMRAYILASMDIFGDKTIETARVDVRRRKSTFVDVFDASQLPADLVREKVTTSPDKTAIKARINAGQDVPGATLSQRESLIIK